MIKFTDKERQIADHLALGHQNKEIAQDLSTTEQVVKNALRMMYAKAGKHTRLEFALWWIERRRQKQDLEREREQEQIETIQLQEKES